MPRHGNVGVVGPARCDTGRRWRQRRLFWPSIVGLTYAVINIAVLAIEYSSEMSKLSRGFYSDTFSPFVVSHLLTFPTSAIRRDWRGYPQFWDSGQFHAAVRDAVVPLVVTVFIQAALLAMVVWLIERAARGRS
jgi:hypothetical protein